MPNGEVVKLDGSDTLWIEIKKSDIGDDGSLLLTVLDERGNAAGRICGAVGAVFIFRHKQHNEWDMAGADVWLLIGIGVLGVDRYGSISDYEEEEPCMSADSYNG